MMGLAVRAVESALVTAIARSSLAKPSGLVLPRLHSPLPVSGLHSNPTGEVSTMGKAHNIASISISPTLSIHLKYTRVYQLLKVWAVVKQGEPIQISINFWQLSETKPETKMDEFVITSTNELRLLIEQIRKEAIFIDTGKRVRLVTNLWGEVWRLQPAHLALLQEKETQDAKATNNSQPESQLGL
jgi:hypothetical protein